MAPDVPHFAELPAEILQAILFHSPPKSAQALLQTSKRLNQIASEPLLWRHYCLAKWNYWDESDMLHRKLAAPVSTVPWKEIFLARKRIDHAIGVVLDGVINEYRGRIRPIESIVDFGYDAKDELL